MALAVAFLIFAVAILFFAAGLYVGRKSKVIPIEEHKHIWSPWDSYTTEIVNTNTGELIRRAPAQKRQCLDCNLDERKLVELAGLRK